MALPVDNFRSFLSNSPYDISKDVYGQSVLDYLKKEQAKQFDIAKEQAYYGGYKGSGAMGQMYGDLAEQQARTTGSTIAELAEKAKSQQMQQQGNFMNMFTNLMNQINTGQLDTPAATSLARYYASQFGMPLPDDETLKTWFKPINIGNEPEQVDFERQTTGLDVVLNRAKEMATFYKAFGYTQRHNALQMKLDRMNQIRPYVDADIATKEEKSEYLRLLAELREMPEIKDYI